MIQVGSMIYSTQAQADAAQWRARYMAAHDVLLAVESFIEDTEHPDWTNTDWNKYRAMRAAFLAYRASIEAGAPLGWAVAGEPAEIRRGIVSVAEFRAMMQDDDGREVDA